MDTNWLKWFSDNQNYVFSNYPERILDKMKDDMIEKPELNLKFPIP